MSLFSLLKVSLAAAVVSTAFAGAALAQTQSISARLQAPLQGRGQVVAANTIWRCEADACSARSRQSVSVNACRAFVRAAGPVSAYGSETDQLTDEQLASCNAAARNAGRTVRQASN